MTHPVAVFVSGTGRHMENFVQLSRSGELDIDVRLVLSSRSSALALEKAKALDIPAVAVPGKGADHARYSQAIFAAAARAGAETVLLAGFLRMLVIPDGWQNRVLNIHPSLLPAFGGQGYYGNFVHQAVLDRGVQISGCTVHMVDDEYDHGRILLQKSCPVLPDDSADSLADRVFAVEQEAYPEAVRNFLS
ncbi:MAG: phosphoribosylglycinamide formyltransferase-1 [Planctomycetota bacterium]|jgi:phosphoribosylglycinamide formyltransferase-1